MTKSLAQIVADANVRSIALIGLSKNVGKTTTTNFLLETLIREKHFRPDELALTSLGLDGEATDALTGLPKPRYVPQSGLLIATTEELMILAEREGAQFERLEQLPGRTVLGPVVIARVLYPGRVTIAGPTLLHNLRHAIYQLRRFGASLSIVDGAINRVGAAAPSITNGCIVCTGTSAGATPETVALRTADVVRRLSTQQTSYTGMYELQSCQAKLYKYSIEEVVITPFDGENTPAYESEWIVKQIATSPKSAFILNGALTDTLARTLLAELNKVRTIVSMAELVVQDATRIFCHSAIIQRLHDRGLVIRVLKPIQILALTVNPYTPEYPCSSQHLLESLATAVPEPYPPIIDVVSGFTCS